MANNNGKLFQYAVLWHPTEKEVKDGQKSKIIVSPTNILAANEKQVGMKAVMEIPVDYKDQLEQVEVLVNPF